eukprot:Colp12_sorted_trinity150504_noHs@28648
MEPHQSVWRHLAIGTASGVLSRLATYPLDTIRTQEMVERVKSTPSFWRSMQKLNVMRMYRGALTTVAISGPACAVYLFMYDAAKHANPLPSPLLTHLAAGLAAEAVSGLLWTPMEVIKQRLQADQQVARYKGAVDVVAEALRTEGPRGLLRGYLSCLAVYGPYSALFFATFEHLNGLIVHPSSVQSPLMTFMAATAASGVAAAVTTPLDVCRTRWQVQVRGDGWLGLQYKTLGAMVRHMYVEEGLRAFSRGFAARVLTTAPSTGLFFALYHYLAHSL